MFQRWQVESLAPSKRIALRSSPSYWHLAFHTADWLSMTVTPRIPGVQHVPIADVLYITVTGSEHGPGGIRYIMIVNLAENSWLQSTIYWPISCPLPSPKLTSRRIKTHFLAVWEAEVHTYYFLSLCLTICSVLVAICNSNILNDHIFFNSLLIPRTRTLMLLVYM